MAWTASERAEFAALKLRVTTVEKRVDVVEARVTKLEGPVVQPPVPTPPPLQPPNCTTLPSIPMTATVGIPMIANPGAWTGDPTLYPQWNAEGSDIASATQIAYTPVAADVGKRVSLYVSARNAAGWCLEGPKQSNWSLAVVGAVTQPPVPIPPSSGGLKTTTAVGSMTAGGNGFKVAARTLFAVGDPVIVEIGGEAGKGVRGSIGVGGVYVATNSDPSLYYNNAQVPRALVAKIMSMSDDGLTLSLDRNAAVSAMNAVMYFDATAAAQAMIQANVVLPPGRFACSRELRISSKSNVTISGAGVDKTEIFSPKGCQSQTIIIEGGDKVVFKGIHLHGNARFDGFGLGPDAAGVPLYPGGFHFQGCTNSAVQDCRVTDVFQKAVGVDRGSNCWADRVECIVTDGYKRYIQWLFQWADGTGGGARDCSLKAPIITKAFESFRSAGTQILRFKGVNATCSLNSTGGCLYQDIDLDFTNNCWLNDSSFDRFEPIVDVNWNIGGSDQTPNKLVNINMRQAGYINAAGDSLKGIVCGTTLTAYVKGGSYTAPAYKEGTAGQGPLGINFDQGGTCFVDGFTCKGATPSRSIHIDKGDVRNTTADGKIEIGTKLPFPADF